MISRRKFLKVGTLVALATALPLTSAATTMANEFGFDGGNGFVFDPQQIAKDPLSNYTRATFEQYINSVFTLTGGPRTVEVTLLEVKDTTPANTRGESFTLLFRGGAIDLGQQIYSVHHPALGDFLLFLVPSGTDKNGAQGYVATFNRLAFGTMPASLPKRPKGDGAGKSQKNPSTQKTKEVQPVSTPKTVTPAPETTEKKPGKSGVEELSDSMR